MPTNRTPINRTSHARITPEITSLSERGLEIQMTTCRRALERSGRRAEYIDIGNRLHELLCLRAFHPWPLDISGGPAADDPHPEYWRQLVKQRSELMASTDRRWTD